MLSPKSATTDLGDKVAEYQALSSVKEYLIVDSRRRWERLYHRDDSAHLVFDADVVSGELTLQSIDLAIELDDVYAAARVR